MTTTHDDVRAAAKEVLSSNGIYSTHTVKALARFVDAVLNPPPDVKHAIQAVRNRVKNRVADNEKIAEWFVSITTPAAKETT